MVQDSLDIVILGLTITSSWGNGHATTYRGLVRELSRRGHRVVFLERDMPWYADNRDLPRPAYGKTYLYRSLRDLRRRFTTHVRLADVVIVGSFVPEGAAVGRWLIDTAFGVTAFYDIDTPVTLEKLAADECEYLDPALIPQYDLYLSFTGGPILDALESRWGAQRARPLYCSADSDIYRPLDCPIQWDIGYLGTYSADRQPALERLLIEPAIACPSERFVVAGPQFPPEIQWPANVVRTEHLAPGDHPGFFSAQRFTLNVTRAGMVQSGYAPSVRLFEAAACGTPIISDRWPGIETFFEPQREILLADTADDVLACLRDMPDMQRRQIGRRARRRVLASHTAAHRAVELEQYLLESMAGGPTTAPCRDHGMNKRQSGQIHA